MITIVSSTHRKGSYTLKAAKHVKTLCLSYRNKPIQLFSLQELPSDFCFSAFQKNHKSFEEQVKKYVVDAEAFIFLVPEYNGSFPGILKCWIDCIHPSHFHHKPAGLIGISSGRAGNLRGMEHLTGILQHLKMHVFHLKQPVSRIEEVFKNSRPDAEFHRTLEIWLEEYMKFLNRFINQPHRLIK